MKLLNSLLTILLIIRPFSLKDDYDRLLSQMSIKEKVGQMFFIRLEALDPNYISDKESGKYIKHDVLNDEMIKTYNDYPCGGIVLFGKNLTDERQLINLTNNIHALSLPPLICIDEEGGLVSRIANSNKFPIKKTNNNNKLETYDQAYNQGYYIGSYLKKYHIDLDFAPVADINSAASQDIIGDRSFGSDPYQVSSFANAFINGLKDNEISACLKHFPGLGNGETDTHNDEASIEDSLDMIKEEELIPFVENLNSVDIIMVGHLNMPNVTDDSLPVSLSYKIITELLKNDYHYDGLVITDSFEMAAITKYYKNSEVPIMAINAGVDILLMPENYKEAFDSVIKAIDDNKISEARIDESVKKILLLKAKHKLIESPSANFLKQYYKKD